MEGCSSVLCNVFFVDIPALVSVGFRKFVLAIYYKRHPSLSNYEKHVIVMMLLEDLFYHN